MNVQEAIAAHAQWKIKLAVYLKKPDNSVSFEQLGADDRCELGKWIYGDGAEFKGTPEYETVRSAHAKFHRAAAAVVRKANIDKSLDADSVLGPHSEFGAASTAVVLALKALAAKHS